MNTIRINLKKWDLFCVRGGSLDYCTELLTNRKLKLECEEDKDEEFKELQKQGLKRPMFHHKKEPGAKFNFIMKFGAFNLWIGTYEIGTGGLVNLRLVKPGCASASFIYVEFIPGQRIYS